MPRKPARKSRKLNSKRKKGFSWKLFKRTRKAKKKAAKAVSVLALLSLSLIFLFTIFAYKSITIPFASASSLNSSDINSRGYITTLILSIDSFSSETPRAEVALLTIYDFDDRKIHVYSIPGDLKVDVPGRFGVEEYSRILPLTVSVNNGDIDEGIKTFTHSLEKTTALNVDGYIAVEKGIWDEASEAMLHGKSTGLLSLETIKSLNNSVKTSLNLSTVYMLFDFAGELTESSVEFNDYDSSFYADEYALDESIQKITFNSLAAEENKSIAILNGAEESGLANFGSRVAKNLGGRVIAVENAKYSYGETVVIADDSATNTVIELARFFNVDSVLVKGSEIANEIDESEVPRADITVIFGVDILESL